ncbi:hypothetical protein [Iamia sp.]|uniref:hypothetical protein n=1 Tax=Iamia sp. TaxID=2722710 RepID=UPI002B8AEB7D|nr:hypothetical protein [Iamia sp.]HXH56370.1 hypothetical protein [Iamia sp.]
MSRGASSTASARGLVGSGGSYPDALTGPLAMFGGLATAALVLGTDGPVGLALFLGVAVWGAASIRALMRASDARTRARAVADAARERRRQAIGDRLDRWEQLGRTADDSAARFGRAAERCAPGPLNERIDEMRPEVTRARDRVHALVAIGIDLEEARADRRPSAPPPRRKGGRKRSPVIERDPLTAQIDEVERRAQDIDTSLAAAVAVAFELALDSVHHDVDRGMDDLVAELGSLRDALAELRAEPDPTR